MPDPRIDRKNLPALVIVWGNAHTEIMAEQREAVKDVVKNGGKLVVIDPRRLQITQYAHKWLRPRPNSDSALAMGMLKIIIEEELYDKEFVQNWTVGFDKLQQEIKNFTIDDVERLTWIPKADIYELARWYGTMKPANLDAVGNTWSQGARNFQGQRLIQILRTIVDPRNIANWGYSMEAPPQMAAGKMYLLDKFPRDPAKNLGRDHKYGVRAGYIANQDLINGILDDKIKASIFVQCDPLITYPDARKVYKALVDKVELNVVANIFMVPTAAIADIVLPVATTNECDTMAMFTGSAPFRAMPKIVEPPGDARSDVRVISGIAKRVGLGDYFWDDDVETMNHILSVSGMKWDEFKKIGMFEPKRVPRAEEGGFFTTSSGKAELYSQRAVEVFGAEPMPTWKHLTNFPQPTEEYPLLLTSHCDEEYKLSGYKHIRYFRKRKPYPTVQLSPSLCEKISAKDGDWVWIETHKGRIMQKLVIDPEMDPRVVMTTFGWWFPENPENANQWDKANINILFEDNPSEIVTGSVDLRGFPCKVYKAEPGEVGLNPLSYLPDVKV